ncbi:MAG: outer membrane beta-barrel protein [Sulfuricurvum sp.]|jgi:hypothetical protein|uniref:outer membrane beta-barrel protein n=1 Tax=Sulfuricurvum sp. TaxID=2025608 RepID=UPI0025CC32B7|nr:outer membrane beta-barrel protein [Sulfuricurvum sp.]MCK9373640.1 outer membrane beta-barrel protein [Sulfuricurvum sp.]
MRFSGYAKAALMASLLLGSALNAKEFKVLPILDGGFCPKPQVGVSLGYTNFKHIDAQGTTVGAEITFDCPVFTLPWDNLRQQIMVNQFNGNGINLTSIELNPYYIIDLGNGLDWGFGPGWGVIFSDTYKRDVAFSVQAGTGLQYSIDHKYYAGADMRWQWTQAIDIAPGVTETLDNYRAQVKVGYRF